MRARVKPKQPPVPVDRPETVRQEIIAALKQETLTAKELSELVRISEKDAVDHLEHIRLALRGGLVVTPAECMQCGFTFKKRDRLKGPGRCPVCHSEHIAEPSFSAQ